MNKLTGVLLAVTATLGVLGCSQQNDREVAQDIDAQLQHSVATAPISEQLPHYLERDIKDEVFYFVMPDRFYNGDRSNDLGSANKPESYGGFDPSSKGHYHGGDMRGLKQKLPYLQQMGITALWMTPIMRNQAVQGDSSGYHGYWVLDFTEIDPHLGSNQDLIDLIDAAHALNMKVFFDIIANHTADVIKFKECHGENGDQWLHKTPGLCDYKSKAQLANGDAYTVFVPEGKEHLKVPAWLNDPKYYNNQGDSMWHGESALYGDFAGLDDINTEHPDVVTGLIDVFKDIVTEFKPDGFRIDTVKHVNLEFWQQFSPAILAHAKQQGIPQFFMFGEVYDGEPKNLSKFVTEGKLQSILDFAFQGAVYRSLIDNQGSDELAKLFAQDSLYNGEYGDASTLVNFTGNHDMGRFAYMLNAKHPNMTEAEKLARIKLSNALMYFSRGIPVVYYGDEQGFVGDGNDKDARQDMMPSKVASYNDDDLLGTNSTTADDNFDQRHVLYQNLVSLANIYGQHKTLRHGVQQVVYSQSTPGIFALTRTDDQYQYLFVANTANTEQAVDLTMTEQDYQPVVRAEDKTESAGIININLAPLSYAIYRSKR
ncbi:alpha-amylase family glycosyl hydrolase [Thalassotalea ponticola]|uniref:alpha-amylase family glycosyl hydrolase n=1 Tax=Thalassotalea ponticola TaxID=1523392 RepID=UPI0025B323DA|nr:alpha-amylase family glycosyl hydrolase [Thalassotalea ponticola]MDN3652501.1 alpha-amylase family glycosyl hydrolase [Thalassotalea ponticola]